MNWILMYCDYAYFRSGEDRVVARRGLWKIGLQIKRGGNEFHSLYDAKGAGVLLIVVYLSVNTIYANKEQATNSSSTLYLTYTKKP